MDARTWCRRPDCSGLGINPRDSIQRINQLNLELAQESKVPSLDSCPSAVSLSVSRNLVICMGTPLLRCVLGGGAWSFARLTRDSARLRKRDRRWCRSPTRATGTATATAGARSDESRKCGEMGLRAGSKGSA